MAKMKANLIPGLVEPHWKFFLPAQTGNIATKQYLIGMMWQHLSLGFPQNMPLVDVIFVAPTDELKGYRVTIYGLN